MQAISGTPRTISVHGVHHLFTPVLREADPRRLHIFVGTTPFFGEAPLAGLAASDTCSTSSIEVWADSSWHVLLKLCDHDSSLDVRDA